MWYPILDQDGNIIEIKDQVEFQTREANGEYGEAKPLGPASTGANVRNLTITKAVSGDNSPHYFKFDPNVSSGGLAQPTVTFSFANPYDETPSHKRYQWFLWLRETTVNGPSSFVTYTGFMNKPGSRAVAINVADSVDDEDGTYSFDHPITEWGTYAFDMNILDTKTGDFQHLRSDKISIPSLMMKDGQPALDENGQPAVYKNGQPRRGHELVEDVNENNEPSGDWLGSYYLMGQRDASQMEIDVIKPNLETAIHKAEAATNKETPYLDLPLYTENAQEPGGPAWIGVFVATDKFKEQYRNHQNKAAFAINDRKVKPLRLQFQSPDTPKEWKTISDRSSTKGKGTIGLWEHQSINFRAQGGGVTDASGSDRVWSISATDHNAQKTTNKIGDDDNWAGWNYPYRFLAYSPDGADRYVLPSIYFVKLRTSQAERTAVVACEKIPSGPAQTDVVGLISATGLTSANVAASLGLVPDTRLWRIVIQTDIPAPNTGGPGGTTTNSDNGDAISHFHWSSNLTATFGPKVAKIITDAHERTGYLDGDPPNIQVMDLLNNRYGRFAFNHRTMDPISFAQAITDVAFEVLNSGQLRVLDEPSNPFRRGLLVPSPVPTPVPSAASSQKSK